LPKVENRFLEVGTTGKGEVVINHKEMEVDEQGHGYIIFSPEQARTLAKILVVKAVDAALELEEGHGLEAQSAGSGPGAVEEG